MGRDKNMLPVNHQPMIQYIYKQLSPHFNQIIISTNNKDRHSFLDAILVQDKVIGKGPLMGIASALSASKNDLNFVIACDIPKIDISLVKAMLRQIDDYDAVVPDVGLNSYEPLFAVYNKKVLPILDKALQSGIFRIIDALRQCDVMYIDFPDGHLANINTIDDYRRFIKDESYVGT
jgi:molybdopterin-guanine dinucleotide biosynthesis protein A